MKQYHIAIFFLLMSCVLAGCVAISPRGRWLRDAEQGSAELQIKIGYAYYNYDHKGIIYTSQDYKKAAEWFRRAAEQGAAEAQYVLGTMFAEGKGGRQDDAEAANWFRKAAEQGYAKAQHSLGEMYAKGRGVAQNNAEAEKWFDKAHHTATEKYRKAAEQGDAEAQYELGHMYDFNAFGRDESVPLDQAEAVKWYREAAKQGNAAAQISLGGKYLDGRIVIKDEVEGLAWYYVSEIYGPTGTYLVRDVERTVNPRARLAAQQRAKEIAASIAVRKQ
jgi:TPR repeat protein